MNEAQPHKSAEVSDFTAEHAKREQEKAKLREAKEKYDHLALRIRNDALAKGAMREDFLKWKLLRQATAGDIEDNGEVAMDDDVDRAVREALTFELEVGKKYTIDDVVDFLSTYTDPERKDTYPLMRYYVAAYYFGVLTESVA